MIRHVGVGESAVEPVYWLPVSGRIYKTFVMLVCNFVPTLCKKLARALRARDFHLLDRTKFLCCPS